MSQREAQANSTHSRENRSLLAGPEKRALIWLANRLPTAINSDHLSAIGLAAMFAAGVSFAAFRLTPWAAAGVVISLAVNWFGDSLDGTVARVRNQQRPRYGYYVDHVIDLAGTTFLVAGLAASGLMSPLMAAALLAAYLLVSAETYLATHARGVFRMSFLGLGPTELRILVAAGALKAAYDPVVFIGSMGPLALFDIGGAIASVGLALVFVTSAVRNTRALYAAERLPGTARPVERMLKPALCTHNHDS
jgi:archaetidylinositol phosphate synthase